jgi:cell division protein FtsQ
MRIGKKKEPVRRNRKIRGRASGGGKSQRTGSKKKRSGRSRPAANRKAAKVGNRKIRPASGEWEGAEGSAGSVVRRSSRKRRDGKNHRWADLAERVEGEELSRGVSRAGRLLIAAVVVAGLGYGGFEAYRFVTSSPHFRVTELRFSPTVNVSEKELRARAGLGTDENIFKVDLDAVAHRLEKHPWVASAKVTRRMPNSLEIDIVEETAAAAVLMGGFYLVNTEGRVFKRATTEEVRKLTVITGLDREEYKRHRGRTTDRLRAAISVLDKYREKARPAIGEIHLEENGGVILYTREKAVEIRMGEGRIGPKLLRLDAILTALGSKTDRLRVIRLDNRIRPERVTVRLAETG